MQISSINETSGFTCCIPGVQPRQARQVKDRPDRLKDPAIVETFQVVIGGKFAPLLATLDEDAETLTSSFNTVMTKEAEEVLGKRRRKVQPWVAEEILDMCDTRRKLKKVKKKLEKMNTKSQQKDQERHEKGQKGMDRKTMQ